MKKKAKIIVSICLAIILVLGIGCGVYLSDYYRADDAAMAAMTDQGDGVEVEKDDSVTYFIPENPVDGLILIAAYSTGDISQSNLKVLSVYGSEDGVLNRDSYEKNRANLPGDTIETIIDGGCHAFFGCYGAQKGDGEPTITNEEQITQTAKLIVDLCTE